MQKIYKLKRSLLMFYCFLGFMAFIIFFLQGLSLYQDIYYLLRYHIPFIFLEVLAGVLFCYFYSIKSLKILFLYSDDKNEVVKKDVFEKSITFPYHFFTITFRFCLGLVLCKALYEIIFLLDLKWEYVLFVFYKALLNSCVVLILSMVVYISLRKMIKPIIEELAQEQLPPGRNIKFKIQIVLVGLAVLFTGSDALNMRTITAHSNNQGLSGAVVFFLFLCLGLLYIRFILFDQSDAISKVIAEIKSMQFRKRDEIHSILPITSWDEVGELTSAYNSVQRKIQAIYKELDMELKLAGQVQHYLLPPTKHTDSWYEIEALSIPARETGGDFFDFYNLDENRVGIVIGDVSGKGVPAALIMSAVMGLIRGKVRDSIDTPLELITYLNHALVPMLNDGMFVTVGFGIVDRKELTFTYVSAGHLPPLLTTNEGAYLLEGSSLPIGFNEESNFKIHTVQLANVTSIITYSDGIIERQDGSGNLFGYDHFITSLSEKQSLSHLLKDVESFSGGSDYTDDLTIVKLTLKDWR